MTSVDFPVPLMGGMKWAKFEVEVPDNLPIEEHEILAILEEEWKGSELEGIMEAIDDKINKRIVLCPHPGCGTYVPKEQGLCSEHD